MPAQLPSGPPIQALVNLLHSGQFDRLIREAEAGTRRWPDVAQLWHLLGLAFLSSGRTSQAITPLSRAAKLLPKEAAIQEHLAAAYLQSGQSKQALRTFDRCLELAPGNLGALIGAASVANSQGTHDRAENYSRRALGLSAGLPEAKFNLALALRGQGKREEALAAFRSLATDTTNNALAQNDIGLNLFELGDSTPAEACFRRAIALAPDHALAFSNLGKLLQSRGDAEEALSALTSAARFAPEHPVIHANRAGLLNTLGRYVEAESDCRTALAFDPTLPSALTNLTSSLLLQGRQSEAMAAGELAVAADSKNIDALTNLGNTYLALKRYGSAEACFRKVGDDHGYALGKSFLCASYRCEWSHRDDDISALHQVLANDSAYVDPFGILTIEGADAPSLHRRAALLAAHRNYGHFLRQAPMVDPASRPARGRLRIGYLSADIHDHATMHLLAGVLRAHDRSRFAIHIYSYGPAAQDSYRRLAETHCERFRDIRGLDDRSAALQIASDDIDILVDLKGYTQDCRLGISALRPAPIIVSWLGYPGTLGHARLADYIIGDPIVTPPEDAGQYSEILALMPHCYQPNDRQRQIGSRPTRGEASLPEDSFVFCNFNQSYKITPEVFDLWCRLLGDVPGSVLWLLDSNDEAQTNLRRRAAARGIDGRRLIFAPRQPLSEHLGRLQLADLAIDTQPYTSHTTGSDALWAGVPLITWRGNTFASRVAASMLNAAGLPELVFDDAEPWLANAIRLAHSRLELDAIRTKLRENRETCRLFDNERFTRDLETLLAQIWASNSADRRALLAG